MSEILQEEKVLQQQAPADKISKIDQMINAGVHFGHKKSKWCPKMKPYVWGMRNKVYYIDVTKTLYIIEKAKEYLANVTRTGGRILWVGTKKSAAEVVGAVATDLGHPYVTHRWIGGTLTNFEQVKKGVTKLLDLREVISKPFAGLKKKEVGRMAKEAARLEKNFGGIVSFRYPPAVLVVVDIKNSATAVKEALACNIPVIGLVDTNSDPTGLTITIPTNDDSSKAIGLVLSMLAEGAKQGAAQYKEAKDAEHKKNVIEKAMDKVKGDSDRSNSGHRNNSANRSSAAGERRAGPARQNHAKSAVAPVESKPVESASKEAFEVKVDKE